MRHEARSIRHQPEVDDTKGSMGAAVYQGIPDVLGKLPLPADKQSRESAMTRESRQVSRHLMYHYRKSPCSGRFFVTAGVAHLSISGPEYGLSFCITRRREALGRRSDDGRALPFWLANAGAPDNGALQRVGSPMTSAVWEVFRPPRCDAVRPRDERIGARTGSFSSNPA
jgi:hypothetical protein